MTNRIILSILLALLLVNFVSGESCDQKQIEYYVNTSQFQNAAVCSEANKDYDSAISYYLKSIEQVEKSGRNDSTALKHTMIAEVYSKKGKGFDEAIRKHCDLAEGQLLKEIVILLERGKPPYVTIQSNYGILADCYRLVSDIDKSCNYCKKSNEYRAKEEGLSPQDCGRFYGCPLSASNTVSSESSFSTSGGFPMMYLALGGGILIILLAALFLSKKKKK